MSTISSKVLQAGSIDAIEKAACVNCDAMTSGRCRFEIRRKVWFILALFCMSLRAQERALPPVLTVCQALRDINLYRGKAVVIVGRSSWTFEGAFLHEKCDPNDHILIQGQRWLSLVALSSDEKPSGSGEPFPIEERILREKLSQLSDYEAAAKRVDEANRPIAKALVLGQWVAVYGRIDSPLRLRLPMPPTPSNARNMPGNGYGANGSVPAMIVVIDSEAVPPGGRE